MYAYEQKTSKPFEEAEAAVRAALKQRGFGILTEIDAQKTLKEKIGLDMQPYKILGACNPKFAHQAIEAEPNIGVLLPCNVLLRQGENQTIITCILPTVQLGKVGNPGVHPLAEEVERLLTAAVDEAAR